MSDNPSKPPLPVTPARAYLRQQYDLANRNSAGVVAGVATDVTTRGTFHRVANQASQQAQDYDLVEVRVCVEIDGVPTPMKMLVLGTKPVPL